MGMDGRTLSPKDVCEIFLRVCVSMCMYSATDWGTTRPYIYIHFLARSLENCMWVGQGNLTITTTTAHTFSQVNHPRHPPLTVPLHGAKV